jgi:hypothetical protein
MPHQAIYLDTAPETSRFLRSIADVDLLAIDTEGASFHRFVDRIYLLQLSTRDKSAIIDPLPIGTPAALGALLESPDVELKPRGELSLRGKRRPVAVFAPSVTLPGRPRRRKEPAWPH